MNWFSSLLSSPTPKKAPIALKKPLYLFNTLGGQRQEFTPPPGKHVRMYNCGPTVYGPAHIGNFRSYIFADTLRRTLEYNSLGVKQVINITDVGHLTSDADAGEDKMSKGLRREGLDLTLENMKTLAEKYAALFLDELAQLNVKTDGTEFPRASDYIAAMAAMIKTLEEKGYTYTTSDGVYFDTSKFPEYGKLGNISLEGQQEGARVEANKEKRNPQDFNLWKKDEKLGWESPWGKGFPGWHIECSAMSRSLLGEQLDIHTGGIDHIPVHHNNEIAQSESAIGKKPFARFWLHNAFITIDDEKLSKSLGNDIALAKLAKKGVHPLSLRYFYLTAHYRSQINFSLTAIMAAQTALLRLHLLFNQLPQEETAPDSEYQRKFNEKVNEDLDTSGAIALLWDMAKDTNIAPGAMRATLLDFDRVLGLRLGNPDEKLQELIRKEFGEPVALDSLPADIKEKITEREKARADKDWAKADQLRDELAKSGYALEDSPSDTQVLKKG